MNSLNFYFSFQVQSILNVIFINFKFFDRSQILSFRIWPQSRPKWWNCKIWRYLEMNERYCIVDTYGPNVKNLHQIRFDSSNNWFIKFRYKSLTDEFYSNDNITCIRIFELLWSKSRMNVYSEHFCIWYDLLINNLSSMAPATKVPRTAVDVRVFSYDLRHFVLWVCYEFLTNSEQNAYLVWSLSLNGPFNFCNLFFYFKVLKCSLNELSGSMW